MTCLATYVMSKMEKSWEEVWLRHMYLQSEELVFKYRSTTEISSGSRILKMQGENSGFGHYYLRKHLPISSRYYTKSKNFTGKWNLKIRKEILFGQFKN